MFRFANGAEFWTRPVNIHQVIDRQLGDQAEAARDTARTR